VKVIKKKKKKKNEKNKNAKENDVFNVDWFKLNFEEH